MPNPFIKKKTPLEMAQEQQQKPVEPQKVPSDVSTQGTPKERGEQTFSLGNQTFTDVKEYNAAKAAAGIGDVGGIITPKAAQAAREFKVAGALANLKAKQDQQGIQAEAAQRLIQEKEMTPEEITQQQQLEQPPPQELSTYQKVANKVSQTLGVTTPQKPFKESAGNFITAPIKVAAEVIDGIASVLLSKKSARVQAANAALTDSVGLINEDIKAVKLGVKSYYETRQDFELAEASVNRLERTNHGLGLINLRYWLGGGAETEATIIRTKSLLNTLRAELEAARIQGIIGGAT